MAKVYSTAPAYSDHGSIRGDDDWGGHVLWLTLRGPSYDTFATTFQRNGSTSFTYHERYFHDRSVRGKPTDPRFIGTVSSLYGVTTGASELVINMLVPESGRWNISALAQPKTELPTRIENHTCYVVSGRHGLARYTLAIDSITYQMIRVKVHWNSTNSTINYWPQLTPPDGAAARSTSHHVSPASRVACAIG
jgi:hypothetical protein